MKLLRVTVAIAAIALASPSRARAQTNEARSVTLDASGFDFALDPTSGSLAVIVAKKNEVFLYPKLADEAAAKPIKAEVGKLPVGIVFKKTASRSVFAVVCHDVPRMYVLDAKDLTVVKEITLGIESPSSCVASTSPADPCIWYCGGRGHQSRVGCVNLETLEDEAAVPGLGPGASVMDMAVSADGQLIYVRGPWSPSGLQCLRVKTENKKTSVTQVFFDHRPVPEYVPDAFGEACATGKQVWSGDLKKELAKVEVAPALFLPHKPFCLGIDGSDLVAVSTNSWKQVARLDLDAVKKAKKSRGQLEEDDDDAAPGVANPQADYKKFEARTRVLYDGSSDSVLVCEKNRVKVVPTAKLALPDEPLLTARVTVPPLTPGVLARIAVERPDPRAKLVLGTGPKGWKLDGDAIAWTPGEEDVGVQRATVRLVASETLQREIELVLEVTRPRVSLGFFPQDVQLAPGGGAIVAFRGAMDRFGRTDAGDTAPNTIVVRDLASGKESARRAFPTALSSVAIDERFVYVGLAESEAFYVLKRDDLSDVKRLFTGGHVREFVLGDKQRVLACCDDGSISVFKRTGEGLEPVTLPGVSIGASRGMRAASIRPYDEGRWVVQGALFQGSFDAPKSLVDAGELLATSIGNGWNPGFADNPASSHWGVIAGFNMLQRSGGAQVGRFEAAAIAILPDQPAAACLTLSAAQQRGVRTATLRAEIVFRDLLAATPGQSVTLYERAADPNRGWNGNGQGARLFCAEGVLVAVVGDEVYVVKAPALDATKFPPPLNWRRDGLALVTSGTPTVVDVAARGGSAPIHYALRSEAPGFDVDAKTGVLTVDTAKAYEKAAAFLLQQISGRTPIEDYVTRVAPFFKRLVGHAPAGVPIVLMVSIVAQDSNNLSAQLDVPLLLDVARPVTPAKPETPQGGDEPTKALEAAQRRIRALEKRIAELEEEITRIRTEKDK
jgi:hypothetical protein